MTHVPELVAEMRRLTGVLLGANAQYLDREKVVKRLHAQGHHNFSGNLSTVLDNDLLLRNHSGLSKTCATIAGGMAQIIQAELAIEAEDRRQGSLRLVGGGPNPNSCICGAAGTTHLSHTFACRNQVTA